MMMLSGPITLLAAHARLRDLRESASRARTSAAASATPVTRVTLRFPCAADADRLQRLRELDSAPERGDATPAAGEAALVAEVDGRLRAALPLEGGRAVSDPFFRGAELLDLLRLRAEQLGRS